MSQEFKPTHKTKHGHKLMFLCRDPLVEGSAIYYGKYDQDFPSLIAYYDIGVTSIIDTIPELTPTQMLEAAQAKGIKWTKKWPRLSGWYPADCKKDASWLRLVDVKKRTISGPARYACDEFAAALIGSVLTQTNYSEIYFAKPWWVQS